MNTVQRILKNSLFLLGTQLLNSLVGLFLTIYIARYLGPENFGKYSYILSLTGLYYILSDFGISALVVREVARNKESVIDFVGNGLVLKLPLTVFMFITIIFSNSLFDYPSDVRFGIYIGALIVSFNTYFMFINSIFHSYEKMEYSALIMLIERILVVFGVIYLISKGFSYIEILILSAATMLIKFFISLIVYSKSIISLRLKFNFKFWKSLLKQGFPFGLNIILGLIYFRIDIVMIGWIQSNEAVGIYNAAVKIILGIMIIPDVFSRSLMPVMSRYFKESINSFKKGIDKSFKYLFVVSIPLLVGGLIWSPTILNYIYTKEYNDTILVFQILILILPFRYVNHALGVSLTTMNRQWYRTFSAFICAMVNVCLNIFFIAKWSFYGAAWATLLTESILFIQYYYFVSRFSHRILLWSKIGNPIIGGIIMALVGLVLANFSVFIVLPIMILTYLGYLIIVKDFSSDDILIFNRLINRAV